MDIRESPEGFDGRWFVELLRDLAYLEHLGFGGEYGDILQRLCRGMVREGLHPHVQTLIARAAGEYERRGALTHECVGPTTVTTCDPDSAVQDEK